MGRIASTIGRIEVSAKGTAKVTETVVEIVAL